LAARGSAKKYYPTYEYTMPRRKTTSRYPRKGGAQPKRLLPKKDKIKTVGDVRRAVQKTTPSRAKLDSISLSLTTTPSIMLSISNIVFNDNGSNFDTRQGPKITLGSFRFRGDIVVGDRRNFMRLMVVRSKNQTNQAFDPQDIFYANPGAVAPSAVNAQINTRNVQVLWDKTYSLQDTSEANPAVRPSFYFLDEKVNIRKTIKYNQVPNATATLPRNMSEFYFVGVSDSGVLPNPSIAVDCVTWFKNVD